MAGELESLSTAEPLPVHEGRHNFDRLLALSDGVFAIAITLLALELKIPEHWNGTVADLVRQSWRSMFGFLFGFGVVGMLWLAHRRIFARLTAADIPLTLLNLLLLCLVSLTPAVAELLAVHGPLKAIQYYFALFAAIGAVQFLLWGYAVFIGRLTHPEVDRAKARIELITLAIAPLMGTLLAVALAFGVYDRVALPLVIGIVGPVAWYRRRLRRRLALAQD